MESTLRKYMTYAVVLIIGLWVGFFIGAQYYPRLETKTVTNTVEKPVIVRGEAKTETKTQIAYVPKETIIERYVDAETGKEITKAKLESTDLDARIGKADFNVKLNGKPIQFSKAEDEK